MLQKEIEVQNDDWVFLGEGAAHTVIGYCGEDDFLKGKVLRLPKNGRDATEEEQHELDQRMVQMLGDSRCFIPSSQLVRIMNAETLLNSPILGMSKLRSSWKVEIIEQFSELVENVSYIPKSSLVGEQSLYSFELKPKWGSFPKHPMKPVEQTMCRHCIQQYQKLRSGKVTEVSQFCPIQLFGEPASQLKALCALLQTPQNNLVFRKDNQRIELSELSNVMVGEEIAGDEESVMKEVTHLCGELVAEWFHTLEYSLTEKAILVILLYALQHTRVLQSLQHVQNLSELNDEMALAMFNNYQNNPTIQERTLLDDYMISRGARDCSVLLSFRVVGPDWEWKHPSSFPFVMGQRQFCIRVGIVDFEGKPLKKIPAWYEQQVDLLQCFEEYGGGMKKCQ